MMSPTDARRMPLAAALEVLAAGRRDRDVVVTTMGAAREWIRRRAHPLDFHYVPSTMSGGVPLALGLALAQPDREVLVLSGDGSLLMSLGALVTVADSRVANLTVAVIDNGVYEITGGQRTAGTAVDFAAVAQACGFPSVARFSQLDDLRARAPDVLAGPGPRLLAMSVEPVRTNYTLAPPGPMRQRLERFRRAMED